jgi:uncharacterized SAM-binding protein YcdF (DUF218 family)
MLQRMRRRLRWLAITFAVLLGVAVTLFCASASLLTVSNCPDKADCIVVLGGGNWSRIPHAVELYQRGVAPVILVTGHGDTADSVRMLLKAGVPESAILQEGESRSTRENATLSVPILREHGFSNVVVTTSWYHSRRGLACFHKAAPDLSFHSCPEGQGSLRRLWENGYERSRVFLEWGKILYYWGVYWIPPW